MSPIVLFCFKRINKLKMCINSLKACQESTDSDLIIFSDAGRTIEENILVDEIRVYLKEIQGFKSIQIHNRLKNFGVDYNIIEGIKEISKLHEHFIIIEDDLQVTNQFLSFMNSGLSHFKDFQKILTLSGYNFIKTPDNYIWDCYFAKRTNPWGWATWSHKIKDVDWNFAETENFLTNLQENKDFNLWGSDRSRMLRRTLLGEIRAWDIRLDYYQFKMNLITAYSCKNLVINNGFNDLDASNTTGYNRFKVNLEFFNYSNLKFPDLIVINPIIKWRFIFRNSLVNRIITFTFKFLNINN